MPWQEIVPPEVDAGAGNQDGHSEDGSETFLFVLLDADTAAAFSNALELCPGAPTVDAQESVRFAEDRFRPQQTKRSGPGLLAAEIREQANLERVALRRQLARRYSLLNLAKTEEAVHELVDDKAPRVVCPRPVENRPASGVRPFEVTLAKQFMGGIDLGIESVIEVEGPHLLVSLEVLEAEVANQHRAPIELHANGEQAQHRARDQRQR